MVEPADIDSAAAGLAALSICESLLLALGDLKLMGEKEIVDVVVDAAESHRSAAGSAEQKVLNLAAAAILDRIVAGGNSIRRP